MFSPKLSPIPPQKGAVSPSPVWLKKFQPTVTKKPMSIRRFFIVVFEKYLDSKEGCHFNSHRLSAKAFPRIPFRKSLPQGLRGKAFYELPHRQGLNGKYAKAFPHKPFRKSFPQNWRRKAFYELPVPSCIAPSGIEVSAPTLQLYERMLDPRLGGF
ncbi:hypothetical protein AVEN_135082-1 [Araneus ventricosus]|uniref:Uncharacterized protein n=1 Tax=Araneus ventricosus TaxID=182803 RepID=A0A4Y2LQ91_ARAVE|nr:hypothetical protein AVEN_135082-1 [Araneus ventricosus]